MGHRFRLDARPDFGFIDGEVIEIEPPSLLRCRWTVEGVPSTVSIRPHPDGDGTRLELEHLRLPPNAQPNFGGAGPPNCRRTSLESSTWNAIRRRPGWRTASTGIPIRRCRHDPITMNNGAYDLERLWRLCSIGTGDRFSAPN